MTSTLVRPAETTLVSMDFVNANISEAESTVIIKKMASVITSNLFYLRGLLPESAYGIKYVEDLPVRLFSEQSQCAKTVQIIKWMKGCFEAIDRKYLRTMIIGLYTDPLKPDDIFESYSISFSYLNCEDVSLVCHKPLVEREKRRLSLDPKAAGELTKRDVMHLIRNVFIFNQSLEPLPLSNIYVRMKLLYYAEVTPPHYEPPGFRPCEVPYFTFRRSQNILVNRNVLTRFHLMSFRVRVESSIPGPEETASHETCSPSRTSRKTSTTQKTETGAWHKHSKLGQDTTQQEPSSLDDVECIEIDDSIVEEVINDENAVVGNQQSGTICCPCGITCKNSVMLTCCNCGTLQHGHCYSVLTKKDIPKKHICISCAERSKNSSLSCADVILAKTDPEERKLLCVWRQALGQARQLRSFKADWLSSTLQISESQHVASIIEKMKARGYITEGTGRRSCGTYYVNKKAIEQDSFRTFMQTPQWTSSPCFRKPNAPVSKAKPRESSQAEVDMDIVEKTEAVSLRTEEGKERPLKRKSSETKQIQSRADSRRSRKKPCCSQGSLEDFQDKSTMRLLRQKQGKR